MWRTFWCYCHGSTLWVALFVTWLPAYIYIAQMASEQELRDWAEKRNDKFPNDPHARNRKHDIFTYYSAFWPVHDQQRRVIYSSHKALRAFKSSIRFGGSGSIYAQTRRKTRIFSAHCDWRIWPIGYWFNAMRGHDCSCKLATRFWFLGTQGMSTWDLTQLQRLTDGDLAGDNSEDNNCCIPRAFLWCW